jgi:hypothetical protein
MDVPFVAPLAVFAVVVLIVAVVSLVRLRETEMEVDQRLYMEEMAHQRKMRELELEGERVKQGL